MSKEARNLLHLLKMFHPNRIIANKKVKLKENVNHKNAIKIRWDTFCIFIILCHMFGFFAEPTIVTSTSSKDFTMSLTVSLYFLK